MTRQRLPIMGQQSQIPIPDSLKEAVTIAGTLGHTSKMPGYSYGLDAKKCQTGSKLRKVPGSVCSGCYAMTDWYLTWVPLSLGHARRHLGLSHPGWVGAMVMMIAHYCKGDRNYFRWHDSGDLQGDWHLDKICQVAELTPDVNHWMPTREYEMIARRIASGKTIPANLVVRLSAHMIDTEPVVPPELASFPVSTVSSVPLAKLGIRIVEGKGSVECRAVEVRDNKCGECRACWDRRVTCVNYPAH